MADVLFYEKPGCGTNARQKRLLEQAGHRVEARSLLAEPWTGPGLRSFFGETPVVTWFNPAAPRIKAGAVLPEAMDGDAAIAVMLDDPLLIRRPLVEAEGRRCAGFDRAPVTDLLAQEQDLPEGCSRPTADPCPEPA